MALQAERLAVGPLDTHVRATDKDLASVGSPHAIFACILLWRNPDIPAKARNMSLSYVRFRCVKDSTKSQYVSKSRSGRYLAFRGVRLRRGSKVW
jgi:hypothetical protein